MIFEFPLLFFSDLNPEEFNTNQGKTKCVFGMFSNFFNAKRVNNLAKLDDGLDESKPNCYGWRGQNNKLGKNRGILKPSWAFVETKKTQNQILPEQ